MEVWFIATQLETTADRIKAVDRAADMVEEMLKQGSLNNGPKVACIHIEAVIMI